jgi:hypothetical protein
LEHDPEKWDRFSEEIMLKQNRLDDDHLVPAAGAADLDANGTAELHAGLGALDLDETGTMLGAGIAPTSDCCRTARPAPPSPAASQ